MRIVHLTKYLPTTFHGGIECVTLEMAKAARDFGFQVSVIGACGGENPDPSRNSALPNTDGIEFVGLPTYGRLGPIPIAPMFLNHLETLEDANIIHLHLPNPLAEIAILRFISTRTARSYQTKLIPVLHAEMLRLPWLSKHWVRLFQRPFLSKSDRIIAATKQLVESSDYYREYLERCVFMPFCTSQPPSMKGAALADKSKSASEISLLSIGRLVPYKGYDVLIQALSELKGNWNLKIIGSGPERGRLRILINEKHLCSRIEILTGVPDSKKAILLANTDIVIVPSITRQEAFGIVIAEAFSFAKPVLTTDLRTGVAFLARKGDCGAVCKAGSPADLLHKLQGLLALSPDQLKSLGLRNLIFWKKELSSEVFKGRYTEFLKNINC